MSESLLFTLSLLSIPAVFLLIGFGHSLFSVEVEENHSVIVTSFGQFTHQWDKPGEVFFLKKILPWTKTISVSKKTRAKTFDQIGIHDRNGTSLLAGLFIEYSVVDPKKALFSAENWKDSLKSLVLHATTSAMGGLQFEAILGNRSALEVAIRKEIEVDFERWGLRLKHLLVQNISLLPEVNRQVLQGVAAHLEKKKALIEEEAHMQALQIEAETTREVAALKGEALSQMALATSRALGEMKGNVGVFDAYQRLYRLSLSRPEQTILFEGFENDLSPSDAVLLVGQQEKPEGYRPIENPSAGRNPKNS
jgi:regulator of protease activity HflC (stomatin/prohibitin superfamily)